METGHPILGVPRAHNFPIVEFMYIDGLHGHGPVLGRKPHERCALRAGDGGTHNHLVPLLERLFERHLEIRERRGELDENVFRTFSSRGLAGGRWNVHPVLAQDAVEERGGFRVEGLIPQGDILLVRAHIFRMGVRTEEETEQSEDRCSHATLPSCTSCACMLCHGRLSVTRPGVVWPQDSRARMGASIAWAARTGLKYSRRNAILPPAARRNSTYSW